VKSKTDLIAGWLPLIILAGGKQDLLSDGDAFGKKKKTPSRVFRYKNLTIIRGGLAASGLGQ